MKKLITICFVIGLLLSASGTVRAAYTVAYDSGTTLEIAPITAYSTTGAMMDGMEVTAWYGASSSDTAIWAATGPTSGAASGTGWILTETGDTFGGTWTLTNNTDQVLTRLLIDSYPGNTVFDRSWPIGTGDPPTGGTGFGTPGSYRGWSFDPTNNSDTGLNILATYRDLVAIQGNAAVGDLYRYLDIDFLAGASTGLPDQGVLTYIADTDNIIPAPGAILLGSIGVGLVGWLRRRRTL